MLSTIWCLLPILFIIYDIHLHKKRESISYSINIGKICYNCKCDLNLEDNDIIIRTFDVEEHQTLCKSCNRDQKLNTLHNSLIIYKYKFQKFIVSVKYIKLIYWFTIPVFFFILLHILFLIIGIKLNILPWIYGGLNISYWIINIYKTKYTTIKKPSE